MLQFLFHSTWKLPKQFLFLKALTPLGIFAKKHQAPPPLDFQPVCIYDYHIKLLWLY